MLNLALDLWQPPVYGTSASTLTLADGTTRTAEVSAGSGYYSQSSPAVFFSHPAASPPRTLTVSWPDGSASNHAIKSTDSPTLMIAAPR